MGNSHQEEEDDMDIFEEDDTEKSTPSKGDDSGKLSDKDFLEKWNEVSGRKDKTLDAVRKHQEEVRKAFSEKGRKKEDDEKEETKVSKETVSPLNLILKDLYFDKHPEAKEYWDEVESEAKALGKDPFELYSSSRFLQGEAKARFEEKQGDEDAAGRIGKPFGGKPSSNDAPASVGKLSSADLALLRRRGLSAKDVKPLGA